MSEPNIAILLASYNGDRYIGKQIESILAQSFSNWKIYIHDDGSKDKTMDVINSYTSKYPDKIKYVEGPSTGGAKSNFFFLLNKVEADFYLFCDQDDYWLEDKIEKTYSTLKKIDEPNKPVLVFTDLKIVDSNLNIIADKMSVYQKLVCDKLTLNKILVQNYVTGCTMMINRNLREMMIKCQDYSKVIMHDWWAAIIAAKYGNILFLDESTILYRQHGDNSVGAKQMNLKNGINKFRYQKRDMKESIMLTRLQAQEFKNVYELHEDDFVSIYADLLNKNKLQRVFSFIKYGFWKSTFMRNIGYVIFG